MISQWRKKYLSLVFEPPERVGVDDAIPVELERRPYVADGGFGKPPGGSFAGRPVTGQKITFTVLKYFLDTQTGPGFRQIFL
jgi:hypothetical protein